MVDQDYLKTIQSYNQLGKRYLGDISSLDPPEKLDFIKLLPSGGKIIDIGGAGGRDSKTFEQQGFSVIGIDLSDVFLEQARKDVPGAQFIKMDARHLKFPDKFFDAIWANAVLLHIKKSDIPTTLQEWRRILKPGGKVHICVKQGLGSSFEDDVFTPGCKRLIVFFTEDEIVKFFEQVGFKIISTEIIADVGKRKGVNWIRLWAEKSK